MHAGNLFVREDYTGFRVNSGEYKVMGLTGCPLLLNTSFNIRGEPIVGTPEDAYRCFMCTDIDALVLENLICLKTEQPAFAGAEEYKRSFKLD